MVRLRIWADQLQDWAIIAPATSSLSSSAPDQMKNERKNMHNELKTVVDVRRVRFMAGEISSRHSHQDGQFAVATTGSISVITDSGSWIVPAHRAIWVPPTIGHEMHMHGDVFMLNAFIAPDVTQRVGLPRCCEVLGVSELLRSVLEKLLIASISQSTRRWHLEGVFIDELSNMPRLPLTVPLPQEPRLARACRQFLLRPDQRHSIDKMASSANMSRRAFTRLFRESTGMSFVRWRKQACVLEALSLFTRGASVKDVSADLGYSSVSAFTTAFRELFGVPPVRYLAQQAGDARLVSAS